MKKKVCIVILILAIIGLLTGISYLVEGIGARGFGGVSINTLLGSPRQLVCQCCGMPLNEDNLISREPDGSYNEDYCKWCYTDGKFAYQSKDILLDYLVVNMPNPDNTDEETRRKQFDLYLSQLKHWK